MIHLLESEIRSNDRQSSKGNQLKWKRGQRWYKADYAGYEGLAEYLVSMFLSRSGLKEDEYVLYRTEEMEYRGKCHTGCSSPSFLADGMQLVTWERLYRQVNGRSLQEDVFRIESVVDRLEFLLSQLHRMCRLPVADLQKYIAVILTVDAFFLNEDRHMHNLAILMDEEGRYHFCPLFDHGGCLLSDTTLDYPINGSIYEMIRMVPGRTISRNLDEQLDVIELKHHDILHFDVTHKDVEAWINTESYYSMDIKNRARDILFAQMRKYEYLFASVSGRS